VWLAKAVSSQNNLCSHALLIGEPYSHTVASPAQQAANPRVLVLDPANAPKNKYGRAAFGTQGAVGRGSDSSAACLDACPCHCAWFSRGPFAHWLFLYRQGAKNPSPRKKSTFSDHAPQIADKEFKAVYLGKVVVTEKHGPAIIQAAVKNIKAEGKQPYEVDAKITFEEMRLVERGTDYLVQACTMTEVSFSCIDKGDKKVRLHLRWVWLSCCTVHILLLQTGLR